MSKVYLYKYLDGSVLGFSDEHAQKRVATWPRDYSNKPTRRNKYVTINGMKYLAQWVN